MELGETFEETAHREVNEEIGVLLGKLTHFKAFQLAIYYINFGYV